MAKCFIHQTIHLWKIHSFSHSSAPCFFPKGRFAPSQSQPLPISNPTMNHLPAHPQPISPWMVDKRCAMAKDVRPCSAASKAFCTMASPGVEVKRWDLVTYPLGKIEKNTENCHWWLIYPLKMVIFQNKLLVYQRVVGWDMMGSLSNYKFWGEGKHPERLCEWKRSESPLDRWYISVSHCW